MNRAPAYFAWYPSLEQGKSVVTAMLTAGSHHRAPEGGREFFTAVLAGAGVDSELMAWGTHPAMSSYFTGEWDEWWLAKLLLTEPYKDQLESSADRTGIVVEPESEKEPDAQLPVCVIADFTSRREANDCKAELKEIAAKTPWDAIHIESYTLRDVGTRHKQLLVDVATRERSRLQEAIEAAEQVIEVCKQHGGRTSAPSTA